MCRWSISVHATPAQRGDAGDDAQALEEFAFVLRIYARYETAIAELVAPRVADRAPDDPRPRLLGALAMASIRIALDDWLRHGGSLPDRVRTALASLSVG